MGYTHTYISISAAGIIGAEVIQYFLIRRELTAKDAEILSTRKELEVKEATYHQELAMKDAEIRSSQKDHAAKEATYEKALADKMQAKDRVTG